MKSPFPPTDLNPEVIKFLTDKYGDEEHTLPRPGHPAFYECMNAFTHLSTVVADSVKKGTLTATYVERTCERINEVLDRAEDEGFYEDHSDTPPLLLAEAWTALSMAYEANLQRSPRVLRRLIKVAEGEYPADHGGPRDPHSRYVDALGMSESRLYASSFFSDEEMHNMIYAVHGEGSKANDRISSEMYIRSGVNSFVVSRYLQDLFAIQDLDTDRLPSPPFPSIWVQTPYSGIHFMSAHTGEMVEADGFYASTYRANGAVQLLINMWAAESLSEKYAGRDSTLGMRVERPELVNAYSAEEFLGNVRATLMSRDHINHKELHTDALIACFRIYFHVLLYLDADLAVAQDLYRSEIDRVQAILDSRQVQMPDGPRRATKREKMAAQRRLDAITKGTVYLLAPALVKGMAYSKKRLAKPHDGERAQTIVRGHYRMQPYGPREEQKRRRTYIAPHFSPKLEGDADYSALLRSKEYVLE
jgi:hypothetical protein